MQNGYLSAQPGWLTNPLVRSSLGLADPRELGPSRASNAIDLFGTSPEATSRDGSDALMQRILDNAASSPPPMGLYDPRESDLLRTSTASTVPSAFPPMTNVQPAPTTAATESDALIQRLLDNAASALPPARLFDQWTSGLSPAEAPVQLQHVMRDWLGGPTAAGIIGGAGIGGNMPTIPKRPTLLAPEADMTSPNAKLARSLPFAKEPLPRNWDFRTLNYRGGFPRSPNWGSALGRAAGPAIGVPLLAYDMYNSDNKVRTAIADAFGILGSAIGGTAGVGGGPAGIAGGLVGGGYVGNLFGGSLYDLGAYAYSHPEIYGDPVFLSTY